MFALLNAGLLKFTFFSYSCVTFSCMNRQNFLSNQLFDTVIKIKTYPLLPKYESQSANAEQYCLK